ncbi:hypothetical protein BDZ89DRAFT_1088487 [Hymenopellis radicata]|nr:hypothetical protein BDZ89DRAFT_1088487 [Hymenopellis radicata]
MYNGYATSAMNNPFAPDPSGPQSRFPDLNGSAPTVPNQYGSWSQASPVQQQPQQYIQQQQQPQQYGAMSPTYSGYMSPPQGLSPQQTSGSYSYLGAQPQQPAYTPAQQQLQNNPGYVSQFDPYASIGQGWDPASASSSSSTQPTTSPGPSGVSHPREYIRIHKAEIEAWDTYAWKQLIGAFDAVKDAWAAKKTEIEQKIQQFTMQMQYGGGGYHPMQVQQEITRLQGLMKDADSNSDLAAAASFQMHEVFENYRKSGDLASKRRVREASNATLTGCPDWPPAIY